MISDITITYNNKEGLIRTLDSFLEQTNKDFEVIVVDGGSEDGSEDVLKEYTPKFEDREIPYRFVSEKDNGRYDAMNKGITLAKGDWVCFINAGDRLSSDIVIDKVSNELSTEYDIVYGDNRWCSDSNVDYHKASKNIDSIKKGLPFSHQSVFTRTELFKQRSYDSNLKISGDYEWFLGAYLENKRFKYVDICVSDFYLDGISSFNRYDTYKEVLKIREKYGVNDPFIIRGIKSIVWWGIDKLGVENRKVIKKIN